MPRRDRERTAQSLREFFGRRAFGRAEAEQRGISADRLERACAAGFVVRVSRGWYALTPVDGLTDAHRNQVRRHHLTVEAVGLVAAGQSAAVTWGTPIPPTMVPLDPEDIEVIPLPGVAGHGRRRGIRTRRWKLPESHVVRTPNGLLVTDPLRTAIDVARGLPLPFALVSLDAALRHAVRFERLPLPVARELLAERVDDLAGGKGIAAVRRALPWAHPDAESPLESIVRGRIIEAGLPIPRLQVPIVGASGRHYRGDMGLDLPGDPPGSCRLIIEADGLGKYADPADLREEKKRHLDIERTGREIVRVLYAEGVYRPAEFLAWIRRLITGQ